VGVIETKQSAGCARRVRKAPAHFFKEQLPRTNQMPCYKNYNKNQQKTTPIQKLCILNYFCTNRKLMGW
jgi:hypothetical protein